MSVRRLGRALTPVVTPGWVRWPSMHELLRHCRQCRECRLLLGADDADHRAGARVEVSRVNYDAGPPLIIDSHFDRETSANHWFQPVHALDRT
jgi:hypothetical protein